MPVGGQRRSVTGMNNGREHSLVGLAFAIAAGIVVGALALAAIGWVLGLVFGFLAWALRMALLVGLVWAVVSVVRSRRHPASRWP